VLANNEDVTSKQSAVERMGIKRFDKTLFENLKAQADRSSRRRAHLNVHNNYQDPVQRLFIAMMPDSYVRPHRHTQPHKWEFFMVLDGELDLIFFDEQGRCEQRISLCANGETSGVEIPPNVWHATTCHSPVVFMEVKQGPYEVTDDKGFAPWSPEEGSALVPDFLARVKQVREDEYLDDK
tara:strand:- start:359 stop:901 length:543 start_codon:yes stop_codon:yes gene_type:complete